MTNEQIAEIFYKAVIDKALELHCQLRGQFALYLPNGAKAIMTIKLPEHKD